MIATAPQIPFNLKQKLISAVRPFQREYDDMTLRDARRLLGRHGFKMPVLYSLVFHGNGSLKRVTIRENATLRPATLPSQIASDLTVFGSPEQGADDLWSSCLHRIVEDAAKQCIKDGRHRAATLSDAEIESILRRIPDYESCRRFDLRDASLLVIRRVVENEQDLRKNESNHACLFRRAQPLPDGLTEELKSEREAALAWRDEEIGRGYRPLYSYEYEGWPDDDRVVLAYRASCYRDPSR